MQSCVLSLLTYCNFQLKDFRIKVGNMLPVLPKNNPPQSRTEFSGLNDLLTYIAEDYGKKPEKDN